MARPSWKLWRPYGDGPPRRLRNHCSATERRRQPADPAAAYAKALDETLGQVRGMRFAQLKMLLFFYSFNFYGHCHNVPVLPFSQFKISANIIKLCSRHYPPADMYLWRGKGGNFLLPQKGSSKNGRFFFVYPRIYKTECFQKEYLPQQCQFSETSPPPPPKNPDRVTRLSAKLRCTHNQGRTQGGGGYGCKVTYFFIGHSCCCEVEEKKNPLGVRDFKIWEVQRCYSKRQTLGVSYRGGGGGGGPHIKSCPPPHIRAGAPPGEILVPPPPPHINFWAPQQKFFRRKKFQKRPKNA